MRVWRLVRKRRLPDAFTGEGSRLAGGRWNSPGVRVVYVSATLALAQLEYLVHANALAAPRHVFAIFADIPDGVRIEDLDASALPKNWRRYEPPLEALQALGDAWVAKGRSAVLRVPSAVVPQESNYILNPAHADFKRIKIGTPLPIEFDPRLFAAKP